MSKRKKGKGRKVNRKAAQNRAAQNLRIEQTEVRAGATAACIAATIAVEACLESHCEEVDGLAQSLIAFAAQVVIEDYRVRLEEDPVDPRAVVLAMVTENLCDKHGFTEHEVLFRQLCETFLDEEVDDCPECAAEMN